MRCKSFEIAEKNNIKQNPDIHHRRSIRLKGYDYAQTGWYFITICTSNHVHLFGEIENGEMMLNDAGRLAVEALQWLSAQYNYVQLDEWIVMPNHVHAIIVIDDGCRRVCAGDCRGGSRTDPAMSASAGTSPSVAVPAAVPKRKPLGRLIGAFKTVSTKQINEMRHIMGVPVWQRNYYEHVIRNHESYVEIAEYIQTNPLKWAEDRYYG